MYVYVMLWCAMCRMVYVYATLSSLALSSQPVCAWVGWHRCLTVCTYAHIVQTIVSHLLSLLLLLLLYILYNIYTTTIHIPNMIFVYIILCHVKRLCYIPALVYTTLCYTMCICARPIPLWYMTMYITSHTILIYYNNYYYDNSNSYLFLFFIFIIVLLCICVRVCVVLCCLSCVYVCSLMCPRICSYTCICVCVYPASPSWAVL